MTGLARGSPRVSRRLKLVAYEEDRSRTNEVVAALRAKAGEAGILKIYAGEQLELDEDTNVPLLVSFPGAKSSINRAPVQVSQVAPTILAALGLDPKALRAVQMEGTPLLPGFRANH